MLEGAIRSQVNDGPVTTYKAGQSFSELPGDRHGVSANASETEPAKLLAVFVVDTRRDGTDGPVRELRFYGRAESPVTIWRSKRAPVMNNGLRPSGGTLVIDRPRRCRPG